MTVRRRRATAWALLLAGALVVGGCTDPHENGGPGEEEVAPAQAAAQALATALTSGDLSSAPLTDPAAAQQDLDAALEAMEGIDRDVEVNWVSSVYEQDEGFAADAAMRWTWNVPGLGEAWTYPISVELTSTDEQSWQADWSLEMIARELGSDGVFAREQIPAERGDVLGAEDEVLVTSRPVYRIGIDKTFTDSDAWEDDAVELAEVLEFSDPQAFADRVLAHGPRAFIEAIVIPQDNPADLDLESMRSIRSVNFVAGERVLGPSDTFARPLLGRVGEATAEIIENSGGDVLEGDVVGLSGLQAQYEPVLRGTPGSVISVVRGEESTEVYRTEPDTGPGVHTTLDASVQMLAEEVLADVEPASALVAIRPSTGEILAAASGPGSQGWSTATLGQYAPGSTFKMVTALAMLRSGVELGDTVQCPETLTVDGRVFTNHPDYPDDAVGEITVSEAIAQSCNTAFLAAAQAISAEDLAQAAASLGLTGEPNLGVPAFLGSVPQDVQGTAHAAGLIGQGQVLASPLGMATVAASLSAGHTVTPTLITNLEELAPAAQDEGAEATEPGGEDPQDPGTGEPGDDTPGVPGDDGNASPGEEPEAHDTAGPELTNEEAAVLRQAMRAVVTDGTGTVLAGVPGNPVIAKTGTAEHGSGEATRAWMIAIQGDLAVAAFVEDGEHGAGTAGPLLEDFLTGLD